MSRPSKRPSKKQAKEAADRAEARSKGEEVPLASSPLNPPEFRKARTRGRPSSYTPAKGKAICKMLSSGMTLTAICKRPRMPRESVVRWWAAQPEHPFSAQYVRAREIGYAKLADDILDIADSGTIKDVMDPNTVQRDRLRVDSRKWLLSKALPKVYGDKLQTEIAGKDGGPIQSQDVPKETGADHLEGLTKRYSGGLKVIDGGKDKKSA